MKKCKYAHRCYLGSCLNPDYCGVDDKLTDEDECPEMAEMAELVELLLNEEDDLK